MRGERRVGSTGARPVRRRRHALPAVLLGAAAALLVAGVALAFTLPPSQPGRSVYDFAGIWTADTISWAERTATRLRSQTGVELAVVSIPTGQGSVDLSTAEADAKRIMDTWGVGQRGVNNGIVVLFDLDVTLHHGKIYVYGGSGIVDRYLSPLAAQHVATAMADPAAQGDFDGALAVGLGEIADAIDNPGTRLESESLLPLPAALLVAADVAILLFLLGLWWRDGRDPAIPRIDDSVLLPAPPPGLTPSMASLLREGEATSNAQAAALVDLSSRNLLGMHEAAKKIGGHTPIDFAVSDPSDPRVAHAEASVGEPERVILQELRGIAVNGVVDHTRLAKAPQLQSRFSAALGKAAAATPWFRSDPTASINRWAWLPVVPFFAMFVVFMATGDGISGIGAAATVGSTIAVMILGSLIAKAMASRTKEGSWVLGMAMAYRNTLRHEMGEAPGVVSAQQHARLKLPWLETPDALIVWAIALGLADEVGGLISRSPDDPASANWHPAWYAGSAAGFASFGSSISSITTTAASSSGGGYGGGSSGGGGGGGAGF